MTSSPIKAPPLMDSIQDPKDAPSKISDPEAKVKVIPWEDFQQELVRLMSLSSAIREAREKKQFLQHKVETLIQVRSESLNRLNELDEMRERIEKRKLVMGNLLIQSNIVEEHAVTKEEHLGSEITSLLYSGQSLTLARNKLEDSTGLLAGERCKTRLNNLQKMLRLRQQYMVSQVALLYPVKTLIGPARELELDSFSRGNRSDDNRPRNPGMLSISGLQLSMLPFAQMSFFTDKKEVQRSATALGYVAHVVKLIASYLHVPLRYPVRLGGSHSYIRDYAPLVDPTSSNSASCSTSTSTVKYSEFPLFLDGQEATRAAYAIFLLNKDIEQLLSYTGGNSLGPKHVLPNLKELLNVVLSTEFLAAAPKEKSKEKKKRKV